MVDLLLQSMTLRRQMSKQFTLMDFPLAVLDKKVFETSCVSCGPVIHDGNNCLVVINKAQGECTS